MKKVLSVLATLLLVLSYAYIHTHSKEYVTSYYEEYMESACALDPMCMVAAVILKPDTVECLQHKFLSTSEKNLVECLNISANKYLQNN